ncbi:MAG TPA: hypothetical protein VIM63_20320, partial [Rhodoferax sp.]
ASVSWVAFLQFKYQQTSSCRAIDTQTDAMKCGGNCRGARTQTMSLGGGAWRGVIGLVGIFAIDLIAMCAGFTGADARCAPTNSTFTRCWQKHIKDINTNISLHSAHSPGLRVFGYSVSGFQGVV